MLFKIIQMMRPLRIAFGSQMRCGKDTACNYLIKTRSGHKLQFARGVYEISEMIQKYFGKPEIKDPKLLQFIGLGLRDVYGLDIWASAVEKEILEKNNMNLFICDLRFPNEAEMLKQHGFILVRITRKNRIIDRDPNHPSETSLNNYKFDHVIENDGTLEELYAKLENIIKQS
jgi:dephospho-CoA kinase